jgi:uncharacterized protein (TIGR02996 family)
MHVSMCWRVIMTAILTAGDALLAEILERPEDDVPRLVLADWLNDQGQGERAELIQVQIEIARLADEPLNPATLGSGPALRSRQGRLLAEGGVVARAIEQAFGRYFTTPEGRGFWIGEWCFHAVWGRGFVAEIRCLHDAWLERGRAIVASQPVTEVVLSDREPWEVPGGSARKLWAWRCYHSGFGHPNPHHLDGRLHRLLSGGSNRTDGWRDYMSREEAQAASSDACLAFAKSGG